MVDVLQGVINSIKEEYPSITIYDKNFEQGIKRPCFLVSSIREHTTELLNGLGWYRIKVNVVYVQDRDNRQDKLEKAHRLISALREITVGEQLVYGQDIDQVGKSNESVNLLADYEIPIDFKSESERVLMNTLDIEKGD